MENDSVLGLKDNAPFHPIHRRAGFEASPLFGPMISAATSKPGFARDALRRREQGGNAWITMRVRADQPRAEWNRVEGDSAVLTWQALVDCFAPFEDSRS